MTTDLGHIPLNPPRKGAFSLASVKRSNEPKPPKIVIYGTPGIGILYSSTKGAVTTMTTGLSQEVAGEGIRVNAVSPGRIATNMPSREGLEATRTLVPMGRPGQPEEIAEAVEWLMSDKAAYVAGANIRVSGGWP